MMDIVFAIGLAIFACCAWLLQALGLPGNWLIVAAAAAYALWWPVDGRLAIGWSTVIALLVLAIVGELAELAAGAAGVAKAGGSRRGAVLAIIGSLVGSMLGVCVGIPIPIVGSLVAAVVFGALGALVGAIIGEQWKGRDIDTSFEIGKAAFIGRVLGTVAKLAVCSVMVIVTLAALVLE
ncbi:MAG TPA: DUF456 domain-containing protein [Pirellulales bacterium]|jgi:hypothetical protein